ncbi:MAG: aspartyl-phosphate phosphatase Spo0E family protein [Syntrophomonadaceae bacterium]|nr:aspartyl-phosphate phosphatase Spo0E family protein [Syntrophomonadaceae bacterium]
MFMHTYGQEELSHQIEQIRLKLNDLGTRHSLLSTEVMHLSTRLDELIVRFQRLTLDHVESIKTQ